MHHGAPIPPVRGLDCTLINTGGRQLVRIRDGLGISPDAAVPLPLFALMGLFDGKRSILDLQSEIMRQTGEVFPATELERIIGELDGAYFLDSDRFRERHQAVLREWRESPLRPATHAGPGRCYPDDQASLDLTMEAIYGRPGAVDPARPVSHRPLRAVLAPHIDFARGGHAYTWAYQEVRRRGTVPLYVVLGTSHQPMTEPMAVTAKSYDTPWGPVPTDTRFIERLEKVYGRELRGDEFNHKNEHSIEFQVVFLRHVLAGRDFAVVPVLCSGFHEALLRGEEPESDPAIGGLLDALAAVVDETRRAGREVVLVGGVDLAHVGRHFGDSDALTPQYLEEVRARDRELLDAAARVDPSAFFAHLASDRDRRRICGAGPIYSILALLKRGGRSISGEVLCYDQAVDSESDLCVSFASMAFEER